MTSVNDSRGSIWRRWDPHIHTPGTVLNDQFGPDDWDAYLTLIEESEPRIEALGVTDYCSLDRYEEVLAHVADGRLADVPLIFPNVELRLPIEAGRSPVNIHLLISPEDNTAGDGQFNIASGQAQCRRGERLISGGVRARRSPDSGPLRIAMIDSGPVTRKRQWFATMHSDLGGAARKQFIVFAYCLLR